MAGLFKAPKFPDPPKIDDAEVEEERRRQLRTRSAGSGQTIISGGAGISAPILGTSAQIAGG